MITRSLFALSCCIALSSQATCLEEMTLEEKVGQLFIVCFKGDENTDSAKTLIEKIGVGGIIYYNWANDLTSPERVQTLSAGLQALTQHNRIPLPLLLAADQEGDLVARLREGFSSLPGNRALAMTFDPDLARQSAFIMGSELQAVGVNFNPAPVVDVNSNPLNPVIGIRSFGDSREVVASFAEQAVKGFHEAGILTSIKHFPGHGDVAIDSHEALPTLHKSKAELEKTELFPFKKLASETDTVMTAHIMVPSIDPERCATLSKPILDILRNEMDFTGVIIADSLTMEGVLQNGGSYEEVAIKALNAGCDILLFGGKKLVGTGQNTEVSVAEVQRVKDALITAVKEGLISEARLNEAVGRIVALKSKIKLPSPKTKQELSAVMNTPQAKLLAEKIAGLSLKTVVNKPIPSLQTRKITVIAPSLLKSTLDKTSLLSLAEKTDTLFFSGLNPTEEEVKQALELTTNSDTIFFCSYNAHKNKAQANLISLLSGQKKPFIFLIVRDPEDEHLHPSADIILKTFSPSAVSIDAACKKLLTGDK